MLLVHAARVMNVGVDFPDIVEVSVVVRIPLGTYSKHW